MYDNSASSDMHWSNSASFEVVGSGPPVSGDGTTVLVYNGIVTMVGLFAPLVLTASSGDWISVTHSESNEAYTDFPITQT